jgi:hypothetical protein
MTPEERQRLGRLCEQVVTEQDPKKFEQLVHELNDLDRSKAGTNRTERRLT